MFCSLALPESGMRSIIRSNIKKLTTILIIGIFFPTKPQYSHSGDQRERCLSDLIVKRSDASLEQPVLDITHTVNLAAELCFLLCFTLGHPEPNMEPTFRNCAVLSCLYTNFSTGSTLLFFPHFFFALISVLLMLSTIYILKRGEK